MLADSHKIPGDITAQEVVEQEQGLQVTCESCVLLDELNLIP